MGFLDSTLGQKASLFNLSSSLAFSFFLNVWIKVVISSGGKESCRGHDSLFVGDWFIALLKNNPKHIDDDYE